FVAERGNVHLALQLLLDPGAVGRKIRFGEVELVLEHVVVELLNDAVVGLPALGKGGVGARSEIADREIEEPALAVDLGLELVPLIGGGAIGRSGIVRGRASEALIGGDAAAAVDGASAVGHLHIGRVLLFQIGVGVVI